MSSEPHFGFVLEYVTDIESAKRFYTDVLGIQVQRTSPNFVQFDHFAIANDASMSGTRKPEVYWTVDDAAAAFHDLAAKTEVIMPLKDMPFGKVFGIKDPAGEPLYLVEFARNRPSVPAG